VCGNTQGLFDFIKEVKKKKKYAKLNPVKLGLALGIICAVAMVVLSILVALVGVGQDWIDLTAQFYFGYSTTLLGTILGAVYGFIDGFVGGLVFAWLYNKLL